jgi:hypothetical protein
MTEPGYRTWLDQLFGDPDDQPPRPTRTESSDRHFGANSLRLCLAASPRILYLSTPVERNKVGVPVNAP